MSGLVSSSAKPNLVAAAVLVCAVFLLSTQDMLFKLFSDQISLWQFVAVRALAALPMIALFVSLRRSWPSMRPLSLRAMLLRSSLMLVALTCFFTSLTMLTMAEAAAGLYTSPLFVAMLAPLLLQERVGPRRIIAIAAGFIGTMLILRPNLDQMGVQFFLPVAAGAFYGMALIVTRKLCAREHPLALASFHQAGYLLMGSTGIVVLTLNAPEPASVAALPFLLQGWVAISMPVLAIIVLIGSVNVVGHTGMTYAYQNAEASFLAPFDYSYLVFAGLWSLAIWQDPLGPIDFLGMALIAGAGIFISWRRSQPEA